MANLSPHVRLGGQDFSIVRPLAYFDFSDLFLQPLERFAELGKVSVSLPALLQVVGFGLSNGCRLLSQQLFVFTVSHDLSRDVLIKRVHERHFERAIQQIALAIIQLAKLGIDRSVTDKDLARVGNHVVHARASEQLFGVGLASAFDTCAFAESSSKRGCRLRERNQSVTICFCRCQEIFKCDDGRAKLSRQEISQHLRVQTRGPCAPHTYISSEQKLVNVSVS